VEQYEITISQNESMKHSIIALERALADTRAHVHSNTDSSQIEALALANIRLREELQRRSKEVQDLLIARNLPVSEFLDDDRSLTSLEISNRGALQQLQSVSAKNEELARQLERTRAQLAQERQRRQQVEEELKLLRSAPPHPPDYPARASLASRPDSWRPPDPAPTPSPGRGTNPPFDARAPLWYADYPGSVDRRGRNGIEPRRPLG
jgi:hypothetical protein